MSINAVEPLRTYYLRSGLRERGLDADIVCMTPQKLDYIFPFVVFFYGLLMVVVLENPVLAKIGRQRMGEHYQRLSRHRSLAWICFFIGGLWAVQNIWHSTL